MPTPVEAEPGAFVASERVRGQSLAAWLETKPRWREVVSVLLDAGRRLQAAHEIGVVHRAFEPAHVIIDEGGRPHVLDVGPETATPAYMSPEQLRGQSIGPTADQWAFCVVLFEGVYGRRPFDGRTVEELVVQTDRAPPPRPRVGTEPRWLWRAIERGLARAPGDRWPSLRDLLDELEHRRRRTSSLAWGAAPIAIVASAFAISTGDHSPDACERGVDRRARTWNEPARARVQAAFIAADLAKAGERIVEQIDARADAWTGAFETVCEAWHGAEAWPASALDRATACLDAGERRFATVVAAFADPRAVWRAGDLLEALPPPERCIDAEALAEQVEPPRDRDVARAVTDVRERIAWIDVLVQLDRVDEAVEPARAALREAEATAWPPVIAEALLVLGGVLDRRAADEGLTRTEDAHWTAYRVRHHEVAASAASLLVQAAGRTGMYDDALEWAERTRAILERSATAIALLPALDRREAEVLVQLGRHDEAESLVVSSLAVLEMEEVQRPGETARVVRQRGNIARHRGDTRQAIWWLVIAAETLEEAYGEGHSQVGPVLVDLGLARLDANEFDAARDVLQRAVRITENALGPDHRELVPGLSALARAELAIGRTTEAEALLERARALATASSLSERGLTEPRTSGAPRRPTANPGAP